MQQKKRDAGCNGSSSPCLSLLSLFQSQEESEAQAQPGPVDYDANACDFHAFTAPMRARGSQLAGFFLEVLFALEGEEKRDSRAKVRKERLANAVGKIKVARVEGGEGVSGWVGMK